MAGLPQACGPISTSATTTVNRWAGFDPGLDIQVVRTRARHHLRLRDAKVNGTAQLGININGITRSSCGTVAFNESL